MEDSIQTLTVGKDFAKTSFVELHQTADTILVFEPEIHPGGVRGQLLRFKKTRNQAWEKIPEEDFRKIKIYEGGRIDLSTEALKKLIEAVKLREEISKQGIATGSNSYVVVEEKKVLLINEENKKEVIQGILDQDYGADFWALLGQTNPSLADRLASSRLFDNRSKTIAELRNRMNGSTFLETAGDDSWQNWIYKNNWLFGVNYRSPIQKEKINLNGIMPDFLFPRLDGFVDVLEIKLPTEDVVIHNKSHPGSFSWSAAANYAIGQTVNYLTEIERLRFEIENRIKEVYQQDFSMLKPKGYILIGNSKDWTSSQREGLRKLNHALHNIEVITYHDLIERGEAFIAI